MTDNASPSSDLEAVTAQFRSKLASMAPLGATLKLVFNDAGLVHVDGRANPMSLSNEDLAADATVRLSLDTFKGIARGAVNPAMAMMTGKVKVDGELSAVMKFMPLFKA